MNTQFSIRLPKDLRDWLEAQAYLTGQSLNATAIDRLSTLFRADPYDSLTIRLFGRRFAICSSYTGRVFGPYRTKEQAIESAKAALDINGFDETHITDETDQPNLLPPNQLDEGRKLSTD